MKLERRLRGVMETMIKYAFDISENSKNSSIVDKTRGIHELVNLPTTYHRLTRRQINHIPNVILMKEI